MPVRRISAPGAHAVLSAALVAALAGGSCARPRGEVRPLPLVERTEQHMGTLVTVGVFSDDPPSALDAIAAAFAEMARIEALHSTWVEASEVSQINNAAGGAALPVGPDTWAVLIKAAEVSRASGGAFDVTYYALRGLWRFDHDLEVRLPDPAAIAARLPLVGWEGLELDPATARVRLARAGMAINLGGISKGYAVDRMGEILCRVGPCEGFVQAGGDLLFLGDRGGAGWTGAIQDPRGPLGVPFATVELPTGGAFSTSGDYERSFVLDGVRYHHLLDPRTGYPARGLMSVTVVAPDALTADAWSTAAFVAGPERGLDLLEALGEVEGVLVTTDGRVLTTSGLKHRVKIHHVPSPLP